MKIKKLYVLCTREKINVFYTGESPKNFYIIYAGASPQPHLVPPTLLIKIKIVLIFKNLQLWEIQNQKSPLSVAQQ